MASAADGDLDDDEVAPVQEETSTCPCMPHLLDPVHELDARYPPLVAPPDEGLADATDDRRDAVYQHGLGIAEDIRAEVASQGRKRRPDAPSAAETPSIAMTAGSDLCTASATSTSHRGNVKSYPRRGQHPYGRRGQCSPTNTTTTTGVTKPTTTKLTLGFASQARLPPVGAGRLSTSAWVCKPGAITTCGSRPPVDRRQSLSRLVSMVQKTQNRTMLKVSCGCRRGRIRSHRWVRVHAHLSLP